MGMMMMNVDWTLHYLHDHCEMTEVVNFSLLSCDCWTVKTMIIVAAVVMVMMLLMVQRVTMLVFSL